MERWFCRKLLACLPKCISVTLWIHIPNPKFSLCMRQVLQQLLAKEPGYKLFFTSVYKSISMVVMPGKVNPPELCACTYTRVHVHLHIQKCVLIHVCVQTETKSISSIQWGISSKPTASNYNRPCSHCLFSLSFICLPSASYGCSLH